MTTAFSVYIKNIDKLSVHLYCPKGKSGNMFDNKKSKESDFSLSHIKNSLNRIETEQVHQRKDLSVINALLKSLINDLALQKQTDEYFEEGADSYPGIEDTRTSHQTELKT